MHKKVRALFIVASRVYILSNFLEKGGGFLNFIVLKFNVFYFKIRRRRGGGVIRLGIHLSTLKNIKKNIF